MTFTGYKGMPFLKTFFALFILWNLSESFQYSKFSLLPQFNLTMIEIPNFVH